LPFRFHQSGTGLRAQEVEQDSPEEIFGCIEAIVRYPVGYRVELPGFGIPDQTFLTEADLASVQAAILAWEERADDVTIEQAQDRIDSLINRLKVRRGG